MRPATGEAYHDALGIAPGEHVLDVGCGTGVVARRLAPNGRLVGLDPSPAMLAVARDWWRDTRCWTCRPSQVCRKPRLLLQNFEVSAARWIYDTVEDRLILDNDGKRQEVSLSPQQHRLVAHMAARNRHEGGRAVLCQREELIAAIWADEPDHSPQDLAYVVHQLRTRLDGQLNAPELILNERGRGYRLVATCRGAAIGAAPGASASATRRRLIVVGAGMLAALGAGGLLAFVASSRSSEPILREGSRGQDVVALQRDLQQLGYDPVYVDGQYGPLTAGAVRAFQQDNGLVVDGEVGAETRRAIQDALRRRSS